MVTIPLGVLKKGDVVFDPPLPPRKQEAIQRLGYGLLNKVCVWVGGSTYSTRWLTDGCCATMPTTHLKTAIAPFHTRTCPPLQVVLLFPHRFWGPLDTFGSIADDPAERGRYYLFYQYDGISGGPVLAALVAGKAAVTQEHMAAAECVEGVMRVLRTMFGGKGRPTIPTPLKVCLCAAY